MRKLLWVLSVALCLNLVACQDQTNEPQHEPQNTKEVVQSCAQDIEEISFLQSKGFLVQRIPGSDNSYIYKDSVNRYIGYAEIKTNDCADYKFMQLFTY